MRHASGLKRSGLGIWPAAALVAGSFLCVAALAGPATAPADSAPGPVILSVPAPPAPPPRKLEPAGSPRFFPKTRSDVPVPPRRDLPADPAAPDDVARHAAPAPVTPPAPEPAVPVSPAPQDAAASGSPTGLQAAVPPCPSAPKPPAPADGAAAAQAHRAGCADCPKSCIGTSRVLAVGTQGGGAVGLKTYPQSLPLADHEVVLTFDDGPWPVTTARILDILKANGVKATFFLVGKNAAAHPELVRRETEEGHTVAHHSWSHPAITLRGLPEPEAQAEIDRGIEADERALGGDGGLNRIRAPFFRFPGFADTHDLVAGLAKRNIVVFGADLWASDWLMMTPEAQLRLTMKRLHEAGKGILLFHDTRPQTAAMLQDFLTLLKQDGFRIVHIVPGPGPLETSPAPPGWSSETEASLVKIMPRLLAGQRSAGSKPEKAPAPPLAAPLPAPAALPMTEPEPAP